MTDAQFQRVSPSEMQEYFGCDPSGAEVRSIMAWRIDSIEARRERRGRCSECPVKDGMYAPFAEGLCRLPKDEADELLKRWWCHTDPRFCCSGARQYVEQFHPLPPA